MTAKFDRNSFMSKTRYRDKSKGKRGGGGDIGPAASTSTAHARIRIPEPENIGNAGEEGRRHLNVRGQLRSE